ncbi:hypothetical protein F5Y18DRAFT_275668 [Xylariaceae sp. FL1019]|nr:hypothetical protein F5Y18DRAFT_275668 [Xylariaceae sp. FL1019]
MPIEKDLSLPNSPQAFASSTNISASPYFIAFIASKDPTTLQPWCPDVRKALPILESTFAPGDAPTMAVIEVGEKLAYKSPDNHYRAIWKVTAVPTLARYERRGDGLVEVGRLVEEEIFDVENVQKFVNDPSHQ